MAFFLWEAAPPSGFQDAQVSYLSPEVADQLRGLYDQLGSDVGPPRGVLVGNHSGADAAWTLAVHATQQGWRAAVVPWGTLRITRGRTKRNPPPWTRSARRLRRRPAPTSASLWT
jgi:hypothetical protein